MPAGVWVRKSGFTPARSRTRCSKRSAVSNSAKANMPMKREIAASSPQASMAASITSVSDPPLQAGARLAASSSLRMAAKL